MAADNNGTNPLAPRDETAPIMEQTFGDGDTISVDPDNNADAAAIIGSEMCEKILESSADKTVEENDASSAADEYTGPPAASSTPLRAAMEKFRIVDIEKPHSIPGIQELDVSRGDDDTAADMEYSKGDAGTAIRTNENIEHSEKGDAGSTSNDHSDENSAKKNSGEVDSAGNPEGDAGTAANENVPSEAVAAASTAGITAGSSTGTGNGTGSGSLRGSGSGSGPDSNRISAAESKRVPSMVKPPGMPPPVEADAIPSNTYKAIMAGRSVKNTPSALRGTGRPSTNTDCGSFYNKGDNRVSRSVYKENVGKMYVSSMSFNPLTWECSACPRKHSILGGGEGSQGGGEGRTVILLTDQNFPAVLPTGSGNCIAILRIDQGKLSELVDLFVSFAPEQLPPGTVIVMGSLSQLQGEGLQGYAKAGINAGRRLSNRFPDSYSFLFTPPPHGRVRQSATDQGYSGLLQLAYVYARVPPEELNGSYPD